MRYLSLSMMLLVSVFLIGCSAPRYAANWDQLKMGMTKAEVINLLGKPMAESEPLKLESAADKFSLRAGAELIIAKSLFDGWYERWGYGQFEMFDNLMLPSNKAYVVYFNRTGKVVKLRCPLSEPSTETGRTQKRNKSTPMGE